MNILFLTNVLPFQRRNGGEVCSSRLVARLCEISDRVLVVGRGDTFGAPGMPQLEIRSLAQPATEFAKMSIIQKSSSLAKALEWFLEQVMPQIDCKCEIIIAGRGLQADQLPDRVRYLGFVESSEQFFRSSDAIAIPSIAGGGVQEKTIEAIGYGIPVIATDFAVRGIQPCPSHVHIVSTPSEFAAACCRQQEIDPVQAKNEFDAWNKNRQSHYNISIDKLLAEAMHRIHLQP